MASSAVSRQSSAAAAPEGLDTQESPSATRSSASETATSRFVYSARTSQVRPSKAALRSAQGA